MKPAAIHKIEGEIILRFFFLFGIDNENIPLKNGTIFSKVTPKVTLFKSVYFLN